MGKENGEGGLRKLGKPYSEDLRERVVRASEEGRTHKEVASLYKIGERTVRRYLTLWKATGSVRSQAKFGGHMKHKLAPYEEKVKEIIAKRPDITLEEIKEALAKEGIGVSKSAIDRYVKFLGISRKKNASSRRAATLRHSGSQGRVA